MISSIIPAADDYTHAADTDERVLKWGCTRDELPQPATHSGHAQDLAPGRFLARGNRVDRSNSTTRRTFHPLYGPQRPGLPRLERSKSL